MKIIQLSPTDQQFHLATHKIIILAADVAGVGAAASGTLPIFPATGTLPAGTKVRNCHMVLVTAFDFSDTGIDSLLIEVGDGGDTDRFLPSTQLAVDGTEIINRMGNQVSQPYSYLVADAIDALLTCATGGSPLLSEATVGELHIYLWIESPDLLLRVKGTLVA